MEMRGNPVEEQERTFRVARRSLDQCRTRKIGCDRGSPCAPCISARLSCTHSAVAYSSASTKQRVLISAKYEQKIDGIARDIDGIKQMLQTLQVAEHEFRPRTVSGPQSTQGSPMPLPRDTQLHPETNSEIVWGHSAHMIDFIKAIVRDGASRSTGPEANQVLSTLQKLLHALESPPQALGQRYSREGIASNRDGINMPPQESAVTVLRWAKEHASNARISWLAKLLPLDRFTNICQNLYFSVQDYSEIEFILANGFLSYVFFEHVVVSGRSDYAQYSRCCRDNLNTALSQLPLLIPSSIEVVAALTLGPYTERTDDLWLAQQRLFWAVYRLDKGISLRLGQSSTIRDEEISLSSIPDDPGVRTASIQGRAYNELYSPKGLLREDAERAYIAASLGTELKQCINDTRDAILENAGGLSANTADPVGVVYMQCELICQYSLLTLVLRAVPVSLGAVCSISEECLKVAREALRAHEECITTMRSCKNEPLMLLRYLNWAIVHCPFPPFSILLTHAIQMMDVPEIEHLERFAASLEPSGSTTKPDTITEPHHLYNILCKAARLYLDFNTGPVSGNFIRLESDTIPNIDFTEPGLGRTSVAAFPESRLDEGWLGQWFHENQLVMSVLDENAFF
ncbi:C6 transcription factor [Paraphaeosphaeria sporulosa]